jgi:formylglycine-generating enzyme required for sulfatase activity
MYLAADLVSGDHKYYTCAEAVPGGVQDILYKTTTLLMRRIYARGKSFKMGSPSDEPGRWETDHREDQHEVSFSHDYYVGVYEVTQQQWNQIAGAWPSYHSNAACRPTRPVENVSFAMIRGAATYAPTAPLGDSFLDLLRTKTGLAFDLPGVAQWEYACKAGNGDYKWGDGTALDSGLKGTNSTDNEDPAYNALGRNAYNNATGTYTSTASSGLATRSPDVDTTCGTAAVGSFPPNSWGLYDMHGNVYEVCADPFDLNNGYGDTPAEGTAARVRKGGSFQRGPFRHRASYQLNWNGSAVQDTGIRVALTLD